MLGFLPADARRRARPRPRRAHLPAAVAFNAAYFASWRQMRRDTRVITVNAIRLVISTAAAVAVVTHTAIDGLS